MYSQIKAAVLVDFESFRNRYTEKHFI